MHAKSHRDNDKHEIHLEEFTSEQFTSIDSNLQKVYNIIETTTKTIVIQKLITTTTVLNIKEKTRIPI